MIIKRSRFTRNSRIPGRSNIRRVNHQNNNRYETSDRSRIKGSPSKVLDKYLLLAKNAQTSGDSITAEYYFQHADHFSRIMSENGTNFKFNESIHNRNNYKDDEEKKESSPEQNSTNNSEESNTKSEDKSLESVSFLSNPVSKD